MNTFARHISVLMIWAGALSCQAAMAEVNKAELERVRQIVSSQFSEIKPHHVHPSPIDGWYTVRKGAIVAYISGDGRHLMQGDLIDLEKQVNLTEIDRNKARVEMLASLPTEQMISFSPEDVRHSVTVFTDIDCTYCRRLHAKIDEYMANGIEVNYMLYPRSGPASASWVKAEHVWCSDDRNQALTAAKRDAKFETHGCDSSMVGKHFAIGRDVGLTGTPAIVLADGTLMPGYVSPEQLVERLAMVEKVAAN